MVPAPAPAMAPVGIEEEGARDQNNLVVSKQEDVSMGGIKDEDDLPIPCSEPAGSPEVAPVPVEDKGGDTTECSSSFGDTCSGFDDEADNDEPEVNSQVSAPADGYWATRLPRRKKVTAEWRNAVSPIMWRCQWLELRMKELSSQVSKYDRELALIKKENELQQTVSKSNGSMPESMPIGKDHRNGIMKRRYRKRREDVTDTSLYIKKHQILSYYNDKQNKGAETDGLLLDDFDSPVGAAISGLDTAALLDAEEYDMIFEQVTLNDILLTIDGVQSQVHFLRDRLNKAHLKEDKLAFSEENTHVRKYRNTRPQKRKNLNILLKDDDGPAPAMKPVLPDRKTYCQIEDAKGNNGAKRGEWNRSQDRTITMDLLLGVDNSLPNGHTGDLCQENADDILINNQSANEGCPQFEKLERLPSETSSKGQNTSAPVEVKKSLAPVKVDGISSPLKVDNSSAPVVNQEPLLEKSPMIKPVKKRGWIAKKENKGWGSASSSRNQNQGASMPDAKQKGEGTPPPAKEKTESTPSDATDLEIMTPLAAWKKRKNGNKSAATEEREAGNTSSASKKKTGKPLSTTEKQETENSSAAAKKQTANSSTAAKKQTANSSTAVKKQKTENPSPPAAKKQKTESTPLKPMVEKAVLVAVNSRRSQRVRKPKVY
ncbi:hypothetical protein EJB05_30747 [Eragrostis curvula]|uniref:Uncharacterized protein n=1 Tax=Eragrostis curvula TaxID=38414 RepID=A0A5J9UDC6_9POAL|nr:hypothetical protein EJB05_30747 [Eragrostis curvula]